MFVHTALVCMLGGGQVPSISYNKKFYVSSIRPMYMYHVHNVPAIMPPPCMLALGKSGEGAYSRDPNISV